MGGRSSVGSARLDTRDDSGVSVLEFTIVLPLIILLIAGVVQLGNAYHQLQVLHEALREGARVAVDLSKPAPSTGVTCASLSTAAKTAARQYLNRNGLDPDLAITTPSQMPWTITTKAIATNTRTEGGVTVRFIELTGQKNAAVSQCLFCPNQVLRRLYPVTSTSFAIRGTCSGATP